MRAVAYPYHQKLKFPSKEGIVVIKGKQEYACYYFALIVQSALAEKRPAELTESLKAGGNDKGEEAEQTSQGKRKEEEVSNKPKSS